MTDFQIYMGLMPFGFAVIFFWLLPDKSYDTPTVIICSVIGGIFWPLPVFGCAVIAVIYVPCVLINKVRR